MEPQLIIGNSQRDERGTLNYNNSFDASPVKRMYTIENAPDFQRGWQGHKIEQRWFSAITGKFSIKLIRIDNWETPDQNLSVRNFVLSSQSLDVLYIPAGFMTLITDLEENSKLLVMADYHFGGTDDEYRFPVHYFKNSI